jgi:UDP:flavonoid glycosyltransferase YjiC (YdhE family)
VRRVIDEPSFRANAERIAAAIALEGAEDRAAQELEALAAGARNGGSAPVPAPV